MGKKFQDETNHTHQFRMNSKEREILDKFKEQTKKHYGEYGLYEYIFTPTGVGTMIEVKSLKSNIKIDVTDYESW